MPSQHGRRRGSGISRFRHRLFRRWRRLPGSKRYTCIRSGILPRWMLWTKCCKCVGGATAWERVSGDLRRGLPAVALPGRALLRELFRSGEGAGSADSPPRVAAGRALIADRARAVGWREGRSRDRLVTAPLIDSELWEWRWMDQVESSGLGI